MFQAFLTEPSAMCNNIIFLNSKKSWHCCKFILLTWYFFNAPPPYRRRPFNAAAARYGSAQHWPTGGRFAMREIAKKEANLRITTSSINSIQKENSKR